MPTATRQPTVVLPGQGKAYWVLGDLVTFKLTGDQTNGAFTVAETMVPPGGGPPPHVHGHEDETFALLAGEIGFIFGDQTLSGRAGDAITLPQGIPHTFHNFSDRPAKFLVAAAPSGFEHFIHEAGLPATDLLNPPPITDADVQRLLAACPKYDLQMKFDHRPSRAGDPLPKARELWVLGLHVALHLRGEQTAGKFCVATISLRPGQSIGRHSHQHEEELFYILEGTMTFDLAGQKLTATPGTFIHVPAGVVHAIANTSDKIVRVLDYHSPSTFEKFFDEAGCDCTDANGEPPVVDLAKAKESMRKHGMDLVT
jgi:quercetin dioxygenase-like cupin family protein